eukprot:TRINITY_DN1425_c0_g4_i1.p1 TRINITY_DN1425_c0_g4~~TRINITY_DN1425_c0_g4_i1.p1  ORF type:complete len:202 (-),score=42.21 TRINITY_DN1425_c0_g4_i1:140-745(-)
METSQSYKLLSLFDFFLDMNDKKGKNKAWETLSSQAKRLALEPNAGGNSIWSEAYSFEFMRRMFGAQLEKTEMQICYWPEGSKKTDYVAKFEGPDRQSMIVGVSVTRAMKFKGNFEDTDAKALLTKKLYGINVSSRNVIKEHSWKKQILHVWSESEQVTCALMREYDKLDQDIQSNTILLITQTTQAARWIYRSNIPVGAF